MCASRSCRSRTKMKSNSAGRAFCREAELLGDVSHPNILSVFDFGVTADSGLPYLVTEHVAGGDLRPSDGGQRLPDRTGPVDRRARLTGRRPLGIFSPPSAADPRLPREVDAVVLRGLAEESATIDSRRWTTSRRPSIGPWPRRRQNGRRWRFAVAGLVAIPVATACLARTASPSNGTDCSSASRNCSRREGGNPPMSEDRPGV